MKLEKRKTLSVYTSDQAVIDANHFVLDTELNELSISLCYSDTLKKVFYFNITSTFTTKRWSLLNVYQKVYNPLLDKTVYNIICLDDDRLFNRDFFKKWLEKNKDTILYMFFESWIDYLKLSIESIIDKSIEERKTNLRDHYKNYLLGKVTFDDILSISLDCTAMSYRVDRHKD